MVRVRVAVPALLGVLLFGSFLFAPAVGPPDQYTITVKPYDYASDPTPYDDLSADYKQAFDAVQEANGTKVYEGATYPDNVSFTSGSGLTSKAVSHQNTTYLMKFTHTTEGPDVTRLVRTLGSLVAGVGLLGYAGYRQLN